MIGGLLCIASFLAGLGIWLLGIRPYILRHRGIVVTGATYAVSAWADWQQCRELARTRGDSKALALSRLFALAQIGIVAGIVLLVCGV